MIENLHFSNLDQILPGWFLLNLEHEITHWSEAAARTLGYKEEDVLNQHFINLLPDYRDDRENFLVHLQGSNPSSSIIHHQVKLKQKSGVIVEALLSLYPITQEEKKYKLITIEKVTEITELLQYTNNKKSQILDQYNLFQICQNDLEMKDIFDAILVSVTSGQGLKFNRAFLFLVDTHEKKLKGIQAIGPSSKERAGEIYHRLQAEGPSTLSEMIRLFTQEKSSHQDQVNDLVRSMQINLQDINHILIKTLYQRKYIEFKHEPGREPHESYKWLADKLNSENMLIMPLVWHGRSVGLLIADNVITETKISDQDIKSFIDFAEVASSVIISVRILSRLEQSITAGDEANIKLKESQNKLLEQEKLAAKGQLLNQMAHEVRGPLATIGGFASRIYKKLEPTNPHYKNMGHIVETALTLEKVLTSILDQALGKAPEKRNFSDTAKVINKITSLLGEEITDRKISVNLNIQGDLPLIAVPDHHLFEILNNLIKNAIEALEEEGLLLIVAKKTSDHISIAIQDTGPGISQADEDKLYTPYFSTKNKGTGLGLVIVKKLVAEYSGELQYNTRLGKGTTFSVHLPIYHQQ
ncbi:MAG: ATP-binding protein [SAR324 cluster bacterium]|nr:ATP-binding protein [SAR324 cluster bacterium]